MIQIGLQLKQPALIFKHNYMHAQLPQKVSSIMYDIEGLSKLKILIVGVGGIGCELLKVLCKMPINSIDIIDMDTIEISNLNRQFLFKAEHRGQSKALVAKQTIKRINPHLRIEAHHGKIGQFPISFFKSFTFLIMALDNIQTRNYVNKIGVRLNIPTIDAGTLGFKGNVHIIIPNLTRCYSCEPKVTSQKSFPVCTIRMRPEKPIHCIVWAKMLFQVLFSGQEVNNDMKDLARLADSGDETNLLKQLLHTQIINIMTAKTQSDSVLTKQYLLKIKPIDLQVLSQKPLIKLSQFDSFDSNKLDTSTLVSIAKLSYQQLQQQKSKQGSIIFQKDDDNIMHFISSLANLRMQCFSITDRQSFNEVKNMAGNIVPAIASTNSIVSGLQVIQMVKMMAGNLDDLRSYYVQNQGYKVRALKTELPIPDCQICSQSAQPVIMETNMKQATFSIIVDKIKALLQNCDVEAEYSINQGSKQLYNSQQPNMKILSKILIQIAEGMPQLQLVLTDEDNSQKICNIWVIHNQNQGSKVPLCHQTQQIKTNIDRNTQKRKHNQSQNVQQKQHKNKDKDQDSDCGIVELKNEKGQGQLEEEDGVQIVQVRKNEKKQPHQQQQSGKHEGKQDKPQGHKHRQKQREIDLEIQDIVEKKPRFQ